MKITIATLDGIAFEGEATACHVPTKSGEITVLDNHHPLVSLLAEGTAVVELPDGSRTEFPVQSGALEMTPENTLNVLLN